MPATCPICHTRFEQGSFCPRDGVRLEPELPATRTLGGRYELRRKVGEGAMGEVYEAEHVFLHRRVAVKLLRPAIAALPEALARMKREAETTSGLGHRNIVEAIDFGHSEDGLPYLVMEWLDGEDLEEALAHEVPSVETALEIIAQAAAGLAAAHERGVIHRDLKPANLFLTHDRRGDRLVKVLDFGIAKLAEDQSRLTATGTLVGTPNYMAPEQALGEHVDGRADIYALGVILYEMLTGEVPFRADTALAVLHLHTSKPPVAPSGAGRGRGISREVDALVMRCLAKRPEERFASMAELGEAIAALRAGGGAERAELPAATARAPSALPRHSTAPVPLRRRSAVLPVAVAIAATAAALAGLVLFTRNHPLGPARSEPARVDAAVAKPPAPPPPVTTTPPPIVDPPAAVADDAGVEELALIAKTALFGYEARIPRHTAAAVPFDIAIAITSLDPSITATHDGPLLARVSVRYYIDHSIIYQAAQPLGDDRRITAHVTTLRPGKHHVHVEVLAGTRELGHATFDIFVGEDRPPVAGPDHEHGHHDADHD